MQRIRQNDKPAFEAWLGGQLHAQHDVALREQVPEEMLRLAEALTDP